MKKYVPTQAEMIRVATDTAARVLRGLEEENIDQIYNAYKMAQDAIFAKIQAQIMAEEGGTWDLQTMSRTGRLQLLFNDISSVLDGLKQTQLAVIDDGSLIQFKTNYQYSIYALDQATPDSITAQYNLEPDAKVRALMATPYKGAMYSQRIGMISDEMAADIRDELTQSMIAGETMDQAAARVSGILGADTEDPQGIYSRAERIARTEMMRASGLADDLAYEQNKDIVIDTNWLVAPDDKLCRWCGRREGLTDEEIEARDPGKDPFGRSTEIPLHPYCRCKKIPVLKSWKDLIGLDMPESLPNDYRGMRDPESGKWEIQPVQTFNAWLEDRQLAGALSDEFAEN